MDQKDKIGSLWIKQTPRCTFLSGELELQGKEGKKIKIIVFKNTRKKDRQPDYEIFLSQPKPQEAANPQQQAKPLSPIPNDLIDFTSFDEGSL